MTAADKIAEAMVTQSELDAGGVVGVIRTSRHDAVRYNAGWECGDVFGRDSDYDGPTLTLEVADAADAQAMLDAIANMPALADLADAQAQEIANARALIEPLTGHTPGPWAQDGIAIAHPSEPSGYPLDICLMGEPLHFAGDVRPMLQNHEANARILAAAPVLRDTVAALADLADAQAQEIARLRSALNRIADFGPSRRHNQNRNDLIACAAIDIAVAALGDTP